MNKWITLATVSNTIIYYSPLGSKGCTRALYATKYSTKKPLSTYKCIALFKASIKARQKQLKATPILGQNVQEQSNALLFHDRQPMPESHEQ